MSGRRASERNIEVFDIGGDDVLGTEFGLLHEFLNCGIEAWVQARITPRARVFMGHMDCSLLEINYYSFPGPILAICGELVKF